MYSKESELFCTNPSKSENLEQQLISLFELETIKFFI